MIFGLSLWSIFFVIFSHLFNSILVHLLVRKWTPKDCHSFSEQCRKNMPFTAFDLRIFHHQKQSTAKSQRDHNDDNFNAIIQNHTRTLIKCACIETPKLAPLSCSHHTFRIRIAFGLNFYFYLFFNFNARAQQFSRSSSSIM